MGSEIFNALRTNYMRWVPKQQADNLIMGTIDTW
jgi:hypothetical protein